MLIKSCINHYFSLSFLRKKACQKSKVTIKLKFYYSNLKNAVETAKIAVDSCYVLRQFLTPLPPIDFREIRGLFQRLYSAAIVTQDNLDLQNALGFLNNNPLGECQLAMHSKY
jgi:hypothetical protein